VVHFHNTFPLISPAAYAACQRLGVPVVQTLHNFRLLCPNSLFFRDDHPCEDCLGKTPPWPAAAHACYRGSRQQTAVVATMLTAHRLRRTWQKDVNRYIALSEFSRHKFIAGGFPAAKVAVKPNFVDSIPRAFAIERCGFLTVGRLSVEKGVPTLLGAWDRQESPSRIRVVGDGPLWDDVAAVAARQPKLHQLGRLSRDEVLTEMQAAIALVFPSECYENFPVSIAEAFASGLPVIASRHGAMAEIVRDGQTGLLFEPGNADDLVAKAQWASSHPHEMRQMGAAARLEYESKYTASHNYEQLMAIYRDAIASKAHPGPLAMGSPASTA
jgi:glycosyltransferase involved in cell wall biosynthesis